MNLILNHLILSTLSLIRTRLNLMNQNRQNLTPMIQFRPTQILNPSRNHLNLIPMSRIRTLRTRRRRSHCLPNKQTDKRQKGLRVPKTTLNDGASLTHLLNRPALKPIVRGGKLACAEFDLSARTQHLSARMRRSFCRFRLTRQIACGSSVPVSLSALRLTWTAPLTKPWLHNEWL
jgi:hypothetical protein